jgi:hypothetical protein
VILPDELAPRHGNVLLKRRRDEGGGGRSALPLLQ